MPGKLFAVSPAAGTYPANPDMDAQFDVTHLVVHADSGNAYLSFDGSVDGLHVQSAHRPIVIPCRFRKVWVRQDGGAAVVHITAIG